MKVIKEVNLLKKIKYMNKNYYKIIEKIVHM